MLEMFLLAFDFQSDAMIVPVVLCHLPVKFYLITVNRRSKMLLNCRLCHRYNDLKFTHFVKSC